MHQLQEYLILEVTFLWTIIKITFFQFTKTGRESRWMLEAVTRWSSWSISSPFSKTTGWKVAISSVLPDSKPEKNLDPVQPQESFRVHCASASGFTRQLVGVQQGSWSPFCKGLQQAPLALCFFWIVWILIKLPVYIHFSSEKVEELKVLEYIHWNIATSLSIEWRTQKRWRTIKISSKDVTSTHIVWGPSTSSYAILCAKANSCLLSYCADFNLSEEMR